MIPAICTTQIDNTTCPITSFVALPRIGDKVTVIYNGMKGSFTICKITHKEREMKDVPQWAIESGAKSSYIQPYIEVELTNKI